MATIFDLFEVTGISANTTYSTAAGNLIDVVDNVDSSDLNDGEFDVGDVILIGGVSYNIDGIQEPNSIGRFILGDGSEQTFNSGSESNLDVMFLTVSNGGDVRHFIIPNDSYGNMNVAEIRTGNIGDVGGADAAIASTINNDVNVVCFVAGTMIETATGDVPVEELKIGDPVWTRDNGYQEIRYIISRKLDLRIASEALKPVIFEPNSLGPGRPSQQLLVSPQHRMLVTTQSGDTVLVPAKALTARRGIQVARGKRNVTYLHLVFSRHEIIRANATLTESLFPGRTALQAIPRISRIEVQEIFGRELVDEVDASEIAAAPILRFQDARKDALTFE